MELEGSYSLMNRTSISIEIVKCTEGINKECAHQNQSDELIKEVFNNIQFNLYIA